MANIRYFHEGGRRHPQWLHQDAALNTKAKFSPLDASSNGGPDFRIFAGNVEIGAAWKRMSQEAAPTFRSSWTIRASRPPSTPPSTRTTRPASSA